MTLKQVRNRPAKRHHHKQQEVEKEFLGVYEHLRKVDLGPFRFLYDDENEALYLQVKQKDGKLYDSVLKIDRDGIFSTTGAHNASATLENPGRA